MTPKYVTVTVLFITLLVFSAGVRSQNLSNFELMYSDQTDFIYNEGGDTIFVVGGVIFKNGNTMIYCDSAIWEREKSVLLTGHVIIDDEEFHLAADSVRYDLITKQSTAGGDYVELWSRADSLFSIGTHAFLDREKDYFQMLHRPTVFLNYPDSSNVVKVIADEIEFFSADERAEAYGNVEISSSDFNSTSGCAVINPNANSLDLLEKPEMQRGRSKISGSFIRVLTDQSKISSVEVIDSAYSEFEEPVNSSETMFDRSILSGDRILMDFDYGLLGSVICQGEAYSWFYPAAQGDGEKKEEQNSVSGDSIQFTIVNEELESVEVIGGAIGSYQSTTKTVEDTTFVSITDTVNYQADRISFAVQDSIIYLKSNAVISSGDVNLHAYEIEFDTKERIIEAFSAKVGKDTITYSNIFKHKLQPNDIPVILQDKDQQMHGNFLRYSIDTRKGRIITSKSDYETGYFYGENLYRQSEEIFYLDDGRYTTCNADEPHFHFKSSKLKLIEGNKLIARPVVLSIGRLPILAIPFYVFPLEKGRHSGFLPFSLGNIERGERYIRNVGYYWAASEYWDWQTAMDYYEVKNTVNLFNKLTYKKLYHFDGYISGNYARESDYNASTGIEFKSKRWTITAAHNHQFSPSFKLSASGHVQSDANYYGDFSSNLDKKLNRVIRSQVNFSKRFSKSVSLSGKISHDEFLDTKSRIDQLPQLGISLPVIRPFGSGSTDIDGKIQRHWYNNLVITYRPSMINFSNRITIYSLANEVTDTIITTDTLGVVDTSFAITIDTLDVRSRKHYTRADHSASMNFPTKLFKYITLNPNLNYVENWFWIHETDQSIDAGINSATTYRTYRYDMGASMSTKLYGTISPNIFGLVGFRQVITPSVSYRYLPKIDRHPEINNYAGGAGRSASKSQSMTFSLDHLYQAKVKMKESEKVLNLLSINSSFSYDFERETKKLSNLRTSFRSDVLPSISFYGSANHSFYPEDSDQQVILYPHFRSDLLPSINIYYSKKSDQQDFWHPRLLDFQLNASFSLRGNRFIFDDLTPSDFTTADSTEKFKNKTIPQGNKAGGWSLSASYGYSETGIKTDFFNKKSFIRMTLRFNLTQFTSVDYSQYYDFNNHKTINNRVTITRQIHCWTGVFHWVPTGSNRGWGFRLFVTALPAIRIDNSNSSLRSDILSGSR